jgi:hypothetical protein
MDRASANAEASRIQGRALAHKQKAARERGRMRRELRKLDELRAFCAQHGITLIVEDESKEKTHTELNEGEQSAITQADQSNSRTGVGGCAEDG